MVTRLGALDYKSMGALFRQTGDETLKLTIVEKIIKIKAALNTAIRNVKKRHEMANIPIKIR